LYYDGKNENAMKKACHGPPDSSWRGKRKGKAIDNTKGLPGEEDICINMGQKG
jgi:hypothetical protein